MIKEILEIEPKQHQSSGKFSISSIGSCWRKKYMELKGEYKTVFDEKTQRIFKTGDAIHRMMVSELLEKGPQCGFELVTAETSIPEHPYISGRIDTILTRVSDGEMFIVDYKSTGNWTFDKIKNGDYSSITNYIYQVNLYLHFFKLKTGFLLFVNKATLEIEEVQVNYDKELAEKQIDEIINFFKEYVEKNILPPECDGGMWGCEVCKH